MSEEIAVKVHSYGPDRPLSMVYFDPISGKKKAKSSGTTDWREAERLAGELQKELEAGRYLAPSKITWQQFRERYATEHLASLKPKTVENVGYVLDQVEQHLDPDRLVKVNAAALSKFQAKLRDTGIKETTIASILRHIRAALGWAVSVGMLAAVPKVNMPKGAKGRKMKGGAVVGEQFDRMLAAVPKVRPTDPAEWVRYLTGLWLSGLRLQESIILSWDDESPFAIDLSGRRPKFRIKGSAQKNGQDELLPMTPDFAEFILQTPEAERVGLVFNLNVAEMSIPLTGHSVGKLVSDIGEKAGAIVNAVDRKTASAHDLRRSFATRWAKKVAPAILQKLMRHASIATTMGYYVDLDTDEMAEELWANHRPEDSQTVVPGNTFGNNGPESAKNGESPATVNDCKALTYEGVSDGTRTRDHQIHNIHCYVFFSAKTCVFILSLIPFLSFSTIKVSCRGYHGMDHHIDKVSGIHTMELLSILPFNLTSSTQKTTRCPSDTFWLTKGIRSAET